MRVGERNKPGILSPEAPKSPKLGGGAIYPTSFKLLKFLVSRDGKVEAFQHPYRSPAHTRSQISPKTYKPPGTPPKHRPVGPGQCRPPTSS